MTVCIAMACKDEAGEPAIVLCSDKKACFDSWGSIEAGTKHMWPAPGWMTMMSGPREFAKRLVWELGESVESLISHRDVQKQLQKPFQAWKYWLLNEAVARFGIDYEDFIAGKVVEQHMLNKIQIAIDERESASNETSILLTGFIDGKPLIVKIEANTISTDNCWMITGSGFFAATIPLSMRKINNSNIPLKDAAYLVYEAKRFGELSNSVGTETLMCIQYQTTDTDAGVRWLNDEKDLEPLKRCFESSALPPIRRDLLSKFEVPK